MFSRVDWYRHLNNPSPSSLFAWVLNLTIAAAVVFHIVELLAVSIETEGKLLFDYQRELQWVFTLIFMADFCLRFWVAAEAPEEHGATVLKRRLHYVFSPMGMIDVLSFLPGILLVFLHDAHGSELSFLKVMATIRILKLTRYSSSLSILGAVYRENFPTLFAATMIMLILSFTAAAGVFLFESRAQPEAFGSIPDAMWWALVTLTTVGYGDIVPITWAGKVFGGLVMVAGVGMAAIPAGVFASSFVRLVRERELERRLSQRRRRLAASEGDEHILRGLDLSASEKREVEFLMSEYAVTLEQAVSIVEHYRR